MKSRPIGLDGFLTNRLAYSLKSYHMRTVGKGCTKQEGNMHYRVVIFGVKDTTAEIVRFVQEKLCPVDLVVTIHPDVLSGNQVSGYEGLSWLEDKYGIPVYETHSYG